MYYQIREPNIIKRFVITGAVSALIGLNVILLNPGRASAQNPELDSESILHTSGLISIVRSNTGISFNGAYTRLPRNYWRVGGLWVGGIVGKDTLVSTAVDDLWNFSFAPVQEFWPDAFTNFTRRSNNPSDPDFHPEAHSEEDISIVYYDTLTDDRYTGFDFFENRAHQPLYLRVEENTYQWSYEFTDDFIIYDLEITNIGTQTINSCWFGIYVDPDVYFGVGSGRVDIIGGDEFTSGTNTDDIVGFKRFFEGFCDNVDTLDIAYVTDNDGDPNPPDSWNDPYSLREAMGIRVLRRPSEDSRRNFNWWNFDNIPGNFGPRLAGTPERPFRNMNGFLGTPLGDRNKYYVMGNGEQDYDQLETALNHTADNWLAPPANANQIASGDEIRFLVSFGPVQLPPGRTTHFTYAIVASENVHTNPTDFADLFNPLDPTAYQNSLNFDDLGRNARWAGWVYDNPGIDSNGDGDRGEYIECVLSERVVFDTSYEIDSNVVPPETYLVIDTTVVPNETRNVYVKGDGVPDFRAASPPPEPTVRVSPSENQLIVRWNGFLSETTPDPITASIDFEGYRVYVGREMLESDFVLQVSYDLPNYNRHVYSQLQGTFELIDNPFTLSELRALYGANFDPTIYTIDNPLRVFDSESGIEQVVYFTLQDYNQSDLGAPGQMRKIYPNEPFPGIDPMDWTPDQLTDDGYPKYWEYEYVIEDLLPSVPYFVSVTAFDFGSRQLGLSSLESNPLRNAVRSFAMEPATENVTGELDVKVYPNPYRVDDNYRSRGFEGRGQPDLPAERVRQVNFADLPPRCDIFIYTIDGDLVRQIVHDKTPGAPDAMHESWDVLSRNLQVPVSGIYYWVVQTPEGRIQTGKLVLIM